VIGQKFTSLKPGLFFFTKKTKIILKLEVVSGNNNDSPTPQQVTLISQKVNSVALGENSSYV